MAGGSFSLTEKLAVAGAFLAIVAMAVGTEDDPGVVVTTKETVTELRPTATNAPDRQGVVASKPEVRPVANDVPPSPVPPPPGPYAPPDEPTPAAADRDDQFSPELGRVPRDFSNGPPPT